MIDSGSVQKYTLYAIGEVALVVIGILIALQINNLNEKRKLFEYERNMLSEIIEDLQRDTMYLNRQLQRIDRMEESVNVLLFVSSYHDSLESHLDLASGVYFNINRNAIEAIRNFGKQVPINNELRKSIDNYYARAQFLNDLVIIEGDKYFYPFVIPYLNENFYNVPDKTQPYGSRLVTDHLDEVLNSPRFKDYVIHKRQRLLSWKDSYLEIYDGANHQIELIKEYLN